MQISPDANVTCLQGQNRLSLYHPPHPNTTHFSVLWEAPQLSSNAVLNPTHSNTSRRQSCADREECHHKRQHRQTQSARVQWALCTNAHKHTSEKDKHTYLSVMASASEYWFIKTSFHSSSHSWKWLRPRGKRHNASLQERERPH